MTQVAPSPFQNPRKAARARRRDPEYREQYDTGATTRAWLVAGSSPVGASCDMSHSAPPGINAHVSEFVVLAVGM